MHRAVDACPMRQLAIAAMALMFGLVAAVGDDPDQTYTVKAGDTLFSIAKVHGLTVDDIRTANGLKGDAVLKVGQRLLLSADAPAEDDDEVAAAAPAVGSYKVQAGDNLYRIAERFGSSVEVIVELNGLTPQSILQIGQDLKVPGAPVAGSLAALAAELVLPSKVADAELVGGTKPGPKAMAVAPAGAKAAASRPECVWVSESRVHLRSAPSTSGDSLALLPQGTKLFILGQSGMWWQVKTIGGQKGYVAGWVVSAEKVAAASAAPAAGGAVCRGYALEARVNIREAPDPAAERVAVAIRGTPMDVLEQRDGWLKVKFENGTTGWVARHLVRLPPTATEASAGGLVQTALSFLGAPYSRGGTSRGGVDCSGLVYAVCRANGVNLPRSSSDMWGHGQPVDRGNLRPGDLVFFKNTYRSGISHVGIYIGNNQFVHAVRPGRGVSVTSLSDGYYSAHWAGAYRVTD